MPNITTGLCGLKLTSPVFNASGPFCVNLEELQKIGNSASSVILTKSCTLEPRDGNPEPRYYDFALGSINSMGLPNKGYQYYLEILPELKKSNKPVIGSISGLSAEDNLKIISSFNEADFDALELNLSCPNVPGKPQLAYDFEASAQLIEAVGKICHKPWGVKLPPYFDFVHYEKMAEIINNSSINFITSINSIGNGLVIDAEKEQVVIKPKNGFGGLGGALTKPIGLANVRKFRELLRPEIQIIGVGGIATGLDVFEYILAGADAVQVATAFYQEGVPVFDRLNSELMEVMAKKGYNELSDFRNKLKIID